jgi:hypothetical protein
MKIQSHTNKPGNACDWSQRQSKRFLPIIVVAAGLLLGFDSVIPIAAAGGADLCRQTAKALSSSCKAGAKSDYSLALAKCANLADPEARKACAEQAKADLKDALQECKDQLEGRLADCERLGAAAYDPVIVPSNFVATITNPYLPMTPGTTFTYVGQTAEGVETNVVFVTHNTKVILGVTCIEVHDTVTLNGALTEDTLDWFAQDRQSNVWYFGENTHELDGNEITNIDGSFKAGVDGAKPGIVMEANPQVGDFYRQEFALGEAEDMAEVVALGQSATVPFGTFNNCLKIRETTPLTLDDIENKFYAPGVGFVLGVDEMTGDRSELIQITTE